MRTNGRVRALAVSFVVLVAACGSDAASGAFHSVCGLGENETEIAALVRPPENDFDYSSVDYDQKLLGSALRGERADPDFPPALVDIDLITSGGPPPDGIPSIDVPQFVSPDEADFIRSDSEAVIAIEVNGDARAYPVQILIWHEIVNDEVGGVPVAVTYCPLCNSALAYEREFGSRTLVFGTSGELYQSALVMYDRQTESLWAHFTGRGIVGHFAGAELTQIPVQTLGFGAWKEANPDGKVLSTNTGWQRNYGANPYVNYDEEQSGTLGNFFNGDVDPRLFTKARIVGIADESGSIAVCLTDLAARRTIAIKDSERNLVIFHRDGLASALQERSVSDGRDIGQTGVFIAEAADGSKLEFTAVEDGTFTDKQTGSIWDITGTAIAGDLQGENLEQLPHLDTFWFAWATYQPDTTILGL